MFDADLGNAFENKQVLKEEIPEEGAVAVAGKKTQETLTATDLIIERLDIAEAEEKRIAEYQVDMRKLIFYFRSGLAGHACIVRYIYTIDGQPCIPAH